MTSAVVACALLAAGDVAFLALVFSDQTINAVFPVFCSSIALIAVLMTARSVYTREYGDAVAWGYVTVPIILGLVLFGLQMADVCLAPFGGCGPNQMVRWFPLVLFVAAVIATFTAIRACKSVRDRGAASGDPI